MRFLRTRGVSVHLGVASTLIASLSGCDFTAERIVTAPVPISSLVHAAAVGPKDVQPEERAFASLWAADSTPAGFYFDREGTLTLLSTDSTHSGRSEAALRQLISAGAIRLVTTSALRPRTMRTQKARFTFGQLAVWRDLINDKIFVGGSGIVSLDMDEVANRVTVGVYGESINVYESRLRENIASLGIDQEGVRFVAKGRPTDDVGITVTASAGSALTSLTITNSQSTIRV